MLILIIFKFYKDIEKKVIFTISSIKNKNFLSGLGDL